MVDRVDVLGAPRVVLNDGTTVRLRATMRDRALVLLAVEAAPVPRDRVARLFWPDAAATDARRLLRQLLKRMRARDWAAGVESDRDVIEWEVATDLAEVDSALTAGGVERLGPPQILLDGIEPGATYAYEQWLRDRRTSLRDRWRRAAVAAAAAAADRGEHARAANLLEPWVVDDDAALLADHMERLVAAGDRAGALRAHDAVRAQLRSKLDIDVPRVARDLAARLRDRDDPVREPEPQEGVVGRDEEVAALLDQLAAPDCRLVTLLGPGGIGKSTLARMLVARAAPRYLDGARVVELEDVLDPSAVPAAIASALDAQLDGRGDPVRQLAAIIRNRRMLLLLDNLEHLPESWPLVAALLRGCRRLDVVATSRERLRLTGEWIHAVPPLAEQDAIVLVRRLAERVGVGRQLDDDGARVVARAVGSSPLGIELAVPWLRLLSPGEVLAEVERDPSLLQDDRGDRPDRHRSLTAAMRHSWELATPEERAAVEALSVLAAPARRGLAAAVADAPTAVLGSLVDKSLLTVRPDGRIGSHQMVRRHAAARLAADGPRRRAAADRHADAVLARLEPPLGEDAPTLLDDGVAALRHALTSGGPVAPPAVDGLVTLADRTGRHRDVVVALEELGRLPPTARDGGGPTTGVTELVDAALHDGRSRLLRALGRHADAVEAATASLAAARRAGDRDRIVRALVTLGWARKWVDGDAAQYEVMRAAAELVEGLDADAVAAVHNGLGCSAPSVAACRDHLLDGLTTEPPPSPDVRAALLHNLGMVAWALHDLNAAVRAINEGLAVAETAELRTWEALLTAERAFLAVERSSLPEAVVLAERADSLAAGVQAVDVRLYVGVVAGEVAAASGDHTAARRRVVEVLHLAEASGNDAMVLRALRTHGQLLIDAGHHGDGLIVLAHVLGRTERRGDFTCELLNPRAWEEACVGLDTALIDAARAAGEAMATSELVSQAAAASGPDSDGDG